MTTLNINKARLLHDLKDPESRKLFYQEHISTGLPFQIRELRKKRGMTQKRLSEITGFKQSNLSDFENPNYEYTPQIGTLMRLADAFDVPLIVRFGSWEEVLDWETKLSPSKLAPKSFQEALPSLEKKVAKNKPKESTDLGKNDIVDSLGTGQWMQSSFSFQTTRAIVLPIKRVSEGDSTARPVEEGERTDRLADYNRSAA